jgi:Flp pilus assembly protein TadD
MKGAMAMAPLGVLCLGLAAYLACSVHTPPAPRTDSFAQGKSYFQKGDFGQACRELEQAVAQNPGDLEAQTLLGLAYSHQDQVDPAIAHLEAPAAADLPKVEVWATLARLYQKKKMYEQALAAAVKAKRLAPGSVSLGNLLGSVYVDQGKYDQAVAEYEKALERQDRAWIRNNLGLLYIQTAEWDKALHQLLIAVRRDPKNATAHNNLGVVLQHFDRYTEARGEFGEALRLKPEYLKAKLNLEELDAKLSSLEEER